MGSEWNFFSTLVASPIKCHFHATDHIDQSCRCCGFLRQSTALSSRMFPTLLEGQKRCLSFRAIRLHIMAGHGHKKKITW